MQALRWYGREDLRLEDVPEPTISRPDEVIIEVAFAGVCGTDLHEFSHGPNMIRAKSPHPLTGFLPPVTLGHEFSGRVVAFGDEVHDLPTGTRVTVDPCLRCGKCKWCREGNYHICANGGSIGLASDGAFAQYILVPRENIIAVPDSVSDQHAALAEPLAVGLHAVIRGDVGPGDNVLILGGGPIGVAALLCARQAGAAGIFVSEPIAERAAQALAMGATTTFDPTAVDVRREAFLATGRVGPDVVIEATGRADQFELAVTAVRRGGNVALVGISDAAASVDLRQIVLFERNIHGSLGYNFDIEKVLALMAGGHLDPSPLITETVALADAASMIASLVKDRSKHLKVLISTEGA